MPVTRAPWGTWEVLLETTQCKVKQIVVNPGHRLSYQKHFKREEVWTVVSGTPLVCLDGVETAYSPGDVVRIPREGAHRISNPIGGDVVVFIEVQLGTYFGEDDIIRLADDYNR